MLYITFEDDIDELNRRCWAVRQHYQIDDSELAGWFLPWAPDAKVVEEKDGKIKPGPLATQLREVIAKYGIDLVIFDPLIQVYEGDISESDNARMNAVTNIIIRLAIDLDIAVDTLRHDRKGAHEPGDPDRGRGAGSVNDRGRLVRTLTHMSKEEAKKYGISEVERRSLVRYDDAQVSLAAVQDARWFRIIGVPIGNADAVFTNGDIVQCIEPCLPPQPISDLPDDVIEAILREIDKGLPDGRRYSPHHSAAGERQAWKIVSRIAERIQEQAKATITAWVKDGLLDNDKGRDPLSRKPVGGLYVNWDIWDDRKSD